MKKIKAFALLFVLSLSVLPINAASSSNESMGRRVTASITSTTISASVTGNYSNVATATAYGQYTAYNGRVYSTNSVGSPYTSRHISQVTGPAGYQWYRVWGEATYRNNVVPRFFTDWVYR